MLAPLPMLVRHAGRPTEDGWTDVQGATADMGMEASGSKVLRGLGPDAGERESVSKVAFFLHFEAIRMKRKTRKGRIIYYRECYISGTH